MKGQHFLVCLAFEGINHRNYIYNIICNFHHTFIKVDSDSEHFESSVLEIISTFTENENEESIMEPDKIMNLSERVEFFVGDKDKLFLFQFCQAPRSFKNLRVSRMIFDRYVRPRRRTETKINEKGKEEIYYYKVMPGDWDRGELYRFSDILNFKALSIFGKGIGLYFIQIAVYGFITLIAAAIMVNVMIAYNKSSYGINVPGLRFTAVCSGDIDVTATFGCPGGATSCVATYRPNCELSTQAIIADMVMCCVVLLLITVYIYKEGNLFYTKCLHLIVTILSNY